MRDALLCELPPLREPEPLFALVLREPEPLFEELLRDELPDEDLAREELLRELDELPREADLPREDDPLERDPPDPLDDDRPPDDPRLDDPLPLPLLRSDSAIAPPPPRYGRDYYRLKRAATGA